MTDKVMKYEFLMSVADFVLLKEKVFDNDLDERSSANNFIVDVLRYVEFVKQPIDKWMFVPTDKTGKVLEPSDEGYNKAMKKCLFYGFSYHEYDWNDEKRFMVRDSGVKIYDIDLVSLTIENLITRYYGILFILSDTAIKKLKL
jgi:hypothetical protein